MIMKIMKHANIAKPGPAVGFGELLINSTDINAYGEIAIVIIIPVTIVRKINFDLES